jgi:hypothetical protein
MGGHADFYFEKAVVRSRVNVVSVVGAGFYFFNLSVVSAWRR